MKLCPPRGRCFKISFLVFFAVSVMFYVFTMETPLGRRRLQGCLYGTTANGQCYKPNESVLNSIASLGNSVFRRPLGQDGDSFPGNGSNMSSADSIEPRGKAGGLRYCGFPPPGLVGNIKVDLDLKKRKEFDADLEAGGVWKPRDCVARHRVAIIIPYRDREHHLSVLLHYLVPILKRQQLDFQIFVVEQDGDLTFNKGRVMNAGFKEALKERDFHCFVFHDVDLIPENDKNMYSCPKKPRHMSVAVDKWNYRLPYRFLVGGVFAVRTEHYQTLNGYSNLYWGWGAEDDDMAYRLKASNFNITRPPITVGRYTMFKHGSRESSPYKWRIYLLRTVHKRFKKDGLNSLKYNVTSIEHKNMYTHVKVDIGPPTKMAPDITSMLE